MKLTGKEFHTLIGHLAAGTITQKEFAVAAALVTMVTGDTGEVFTSSKKVFKVMGPKNGTSERSVQRILKSLEIKGFIQRELSNREQGYRITITIPSNPQKEERQWQTTT